MPYNGIPDSVLRNFPAGTPPPGVKPNFINPPNHDVEVIAFNTILLFFMWVVVILRVYAKKFVLRTISWDDYTCVIAALGSTAHSVMELNGLHLGFGRHIWDIRATVLIYPENVRLLASTATIYPVVIYFIKLSILLLYLRIFHVERVVRYGCYFGITLFTLFYIAYFGVQLPILFKCINAAALEHGLCKNLYAITVFQSAFNVASDIFVFALPIPSILKLHVGKRQKIGLLVIFLAGLVACGVSVARLIATAKTLNDPDKFWNAVLLGALTTVEMNLAIIAACMSTLPGVLAQAKRFGSSVYKSIRSRLLTSRSGTMATGKVVETNGSNTNGDYTGAGSRKTMADANYIPLADGRKGASTDGNSTSDSRPLWGRP